MRKKFENYTNKFHMKGIRRNVIYYIIVFILFITYSIEIASSIAPTTIFHKSNISMYAFGDVFFTVFMQPTVMTLPLVILYFLNYESYSRFKHPSLNKFIINRAIGISIFLVIIYLSIFASYIFTNSTNIINLGYTDRSAFALIIPADKAIFLSFLFQLFYIATFLLIAMIIEGLTHKAWLAILLTLCLSYIDTGIRIVFNSTKLLGILPSDNVLTFYLSELYYYTKRPTYIFSIIYWVTIIILLYCILYIILLKAKREMKERNKKNEIFQK